jgi:hypothetical protein
MSTKKNTFKSKSRPQTGVKYQVEKKNVYRVIINGPLAEALHSLHENLQASRKFRRLAAGDIHELARECLDRGLLSLEEEVEHDIEEVPGFDDDLSAGRGR